MATGKDFPKNNTVVVSCFLVLLLFLNNILDNTPGNFDVIHQNPCFSSLYHIAAEMTELIGPCHYRLQGGYVFGLFVCLLTKLANKLIMNCDEMLWRGVG